MEPSSFDAFWSAYPRKVGKGAAMVSWKKFKPPIDAVLAALAWQVGTEQWQKNGGQYIPNPATYLNQRRWEDEATGQKVAFGSDEYYKKGF